jgi:hypothetical protein
MPLAGPKRCNRYIKMSQANIFNPNVSVKSLPCDVQVNANNQKQNLIDTSPLTTPVDVILAFAVLVRVILDHRSSDKK